VPAAFGVESRRCFAADKIHPTHTRSQTPSDASSDIASSMVGKSVGSSLGASRTSYWWMDNDEDARLGRNQPGKGSLTLPKQSDHSKRGSSLAAKPPFSLGSSSLRCAARLMESGWAFDAGFVWFCPFGELPAAFSHSQPSHTRPYKRSATEPCGWCGWACRGPARSKRGLVICR
jgi:hypothetical protein